MTTRGLASYCGGELDERDAECFCDGFVGELAVVHVDGVSEARIGDADGL